METKTIILSPAIAREWLKRNTNNRHLRPSHVESLRIAFERGEYAQTHQGLAIASDDTVLDGQHRLTAISLCPDSMRFPILVTRGLVRDDVDKAIDTGLCIRTFSDVLKINQNDGKTATFLARLYAGRNTGITAAFVKPFADRTAAINEEISAWCPTQRKTWSSAPVRAAAVASILAGRDKDYVLLTYRALVMAEFNSMPPVVQSLYRSQERGAVRGSDAHDIFCRCLKAFDEKYANNSKIQIKDQAATVASVRALLAAKVFGKTEMKKTAPKVAPRQPQQQRIDSDYAIAGL